MQGVDVIKTGEKGTAGMMIKNDKTTQNDTLTQRTC